MVDEGHPRVSVNDYELEGFNPTMVDEGRHPKKEGKKDELSFNPTMVDGGHDKCEYNNERSL